MLYSVGLVSGVYHSEPAIPVHIPLPQGPPSHPSRPSQGSELSLLSSEWAAPSSCIHGSVCVDFPGGASGKGHACRRRRHETWVQSLGRPLEEEIHLPPVFLPRESHAKSSLAGYSPQGRKEGRRGLSD